jgi:hypothetical protein
VIKEREIEQRPLFNGTWRERERERDERDKRLE